jgi:hypothetical protein
MGMDWGAGETWGRDGRDGEESMAWEGRRRKTQNPGFRRERSEGGRERGRAT